jgi:hypothetical protein
MACSRRSPVYTVADMAESRVTPSSPPPDLDCARLLHYVVIDSGIEFSGRSLLFVDGKELGAVPCLAICEEKKTGGVLLFHCASDWSVLGCSAHDSVSDAQARAERVYKGVSTRWVDANISREAADAYLNELFANERCRVCGRRPDEVDSFIQEGAAWVCDRCTG